MVLSFTEENFLILILSEVIVHSKSFVSVEVDSDVNSVKQNFVFNNIHFAAGSTSIPV